MPVDIEAILALLPEIFPGVQAIPLDRIRPNPDNPGPPISEDQIQDMEENILASGLQNEGKFQAYKADPLAPGVTLHPDNPRLRGDGQPWRVGDFNWNTLTGERRACLGPAPKQGLDLAWKGRSRQGAPLPPGSTAGPRPHAGPGPEPQPRRGRGNQLFGQCHPG